MGFFFAITEPSRHLMPANTAPFVRKTFEIVSDPSTDSIVCWSPSGTSFLILQEHSFQKEILPKYFKHDNLCSFIRQLNTYGFRKVSGPKDGTDNYLEFEQPDFQKDQPDRLKFMKRKQNSSKKSSAKEEETDSAPPDINEIVADRTRMANALNTLIQQQQETEKTLKALWGELAEAKRVVADLESRKRPRTENVSQPIPDNKRAKSEIDVSTSPGVPLAQVNPPDWVSSDTESEADITNAAKNMAGLSAHMLSGAQPTSNGRFFN